MRMKMENIGKIRKADIAISGLTVIAAANNTGKSTIGKTLFAACDAFVDFTKQTEEDLVTSVSKTLQYPLPARAIRLPVNGGDAETDAHALAQHIVGTLSKPVSEEALLRCLRQMPSTYVESDEEYIYSTGDGREGFARSVTDLANALSADTDNARKCRAEILALLNISIASKSALLVDRYFSSLFSGQFTSMFTDSDNDARVELTDTSGKHIRDIRFEQGRCVSAAPVVNENRKVYIIDSPKLPELFRGNTGALFLEHVPQYYRRLLEVVAQRQREVELNPASGLGEQVLREQKIKPIITMMSEYFNGRIGFDDRDMPILITDAKVRERVRLSNASMGVKAFSGLRYLIENLVVNEKDVLVLDEPEIHLHPDWQVPYAHALTMIAKQIGVRMLITTHSPYFLKALAAYSHIEGMEGATHYYTADDNPLGPVTFREITNGGELAQVYADMASPLSSIDEDVLRHER